MSISSGRGERLLDEVIATYAASVAKDAVQNMTQDAFPFNFIMERSLQHFGNSALDKKAKQEVRITKYGVDFGARKKHQRFRLTGVRHRGRPRQNYRRLNYRTQALCWGGERNIPDLPSEARQTAFPRRSRTICLEWNLPPSLMYCAP
ncbi:MAG TPA: hypothetical protein DHU72_02010 [Rikenellaceae bacterium]|nr:hypothetical protein [Rikenellaceae bacterium]